MPYFRPGSALVLVLFTMAAIADTVHLKNGDAITGTINGISGGTITLKTEYAGEIDVDATFVRWIETDDELMVLLPESQPQLVDGESLKAIKLEELEYIGPPLPTEPVREVAWEGALDGQLAIRKGESDTYDAIAGVALTRRKQERLLNAVSPVSRLRLSVSGAYGEADGDLNTQRVDAEQRYRYYINERFYLLQLSGLRHDAARDLDFRATAGLGVGYDVIASARRSLSVDAALTYDYEQWEDPGASDGIREEDHVNLLLGLGYEERFAGGSTLTDALELIPRLDDPGEVRLINTLAFTAPINSRTFIRFEWRTEYDSDPGPDVDEWDHLLTSGIRYTF